MCPARVTPIVIADREFGHGRWVREIEKPGWYYILRLAKNHYIETECYIGILAELGIRRGTRPRDWGWGTLGEQHQGHMHLVTVFDRRRKRHERAGPKLNSGACGPIRAEAFDR